MDKAYRDVEEYTQNKTGGFYNPYMPAANLLGAQMFFCNQAID